MSTPLEELLSAVDHYTRCCHWAALVGKDPCGRCQSCKLRDLADAVREWLARPAGDDDSTLREDLFREHNTVLADECSIPDETPSYAMSDLLWRAYKFVERAQAAGSEDSILLDFADKQITSMEVDMMDGEFVWIVTADQCGRIYQAKSLRDGIRAAMRAEGE